MGEARIPFHRPAIGEEEIAAVTAVLRSGWLTSGAECNQFEDEFAAAVGARHAVALNSCTAALHLALEATGLARGGLVLVPTLTFAATAEVVTYFGATPVLVDCDAKTLNIDPAHAANLLDALAQGRRVPGIVDGKPAHAIVPVHYGGQMADVDEIASLARRHRLHVIEDAAHAFPAAARGPEGAWRSAGVTAEQTCFSFYANKTITTGEGGMLVTDDQELAARARMMSLHGLSRDAWERFTAHGSWSYRIIAPGYKYNLTDVAAALGRVQLRKATMLADDRRLLAARYHDLLGDLDEIELPEEREDRPSHELLDAIRKVASGKTYFTETIAQRFLAAPEESGQPAHAKLTAREHQVFTLIIQGRSSSEIAAELDLTASTVSNHLAKIKEKLDAHSLADIVRYAYRAGLID